MINIPLEASLSGISGVKEVSSFSRQGQSLVFVTFQWGQDMDLAFLAMREKLDQVVSFLPQEAERSQIVNTTDANQRIAVLSVGLPKKEPNDSEAYFLKVLERKDWVESVLIRRLEQLDGVAQALMVGAPQAQVQLKYKTDALQRYEISLQQIEQAVQNANLFSASGQLQDGWYRYAIKIESRITELDDLANSPVRTLANGRVLRLSDVADLALLPDDPLSFSTYNGEEVLSIILKKTYDANTVEVYAEVLEQLEKLKVSYPDYKVQIVEEAASTIENSIDNLLQSLYIGGALAFIVLFLFLNSGRTPFAIGISIPLSLFATFLVMFLLDIQLNIISLSGLTLGIGLLLDNSIVVLENINRYTKQGLSYIEAARKGSKEIAFAITASTLTTISVFVPLLFLGGFEGAFFRDLSATLSISLLASLLVALFVLPVISYALRSKKKDTSFILFKSINDLLNSIINRYSNSVDYFLKRPIPLFFGAFLLFVLAVVAFLALDKQALPSALPKQFSFSVALGGNQSLKATKAASVELEKVINQQLPEARSLIFGGYTDLSNPKSLLNEGLNRLSVSISTEDQVEFDKAKHTFEALKRSFSTWQFQQLGDAEQASGNTSFFASSNAMVALSFVGLDRTFNEQRAPFVEELLQEAFNDFKMEPVFSQKVKRYDLRFKADAIQYFRLSEQQIIDLVESLGNGLWVSQWNRQDEQWPIRLKAPKATFEDPSSILLPINNRFIPLTELAEWQERSESVQLERASQRAVLSYATNWTYLDWFWKGEALQKKVQEIALENDMEIEVKGQALVLDRLLKDMAKLLLLSVFLIYLILTIQYEDLVYPLLIVLAIPFAWIGSFFALYLFGQSLNTLSFMGMLILTGIAVNDAILKVDFMRRYLYEEGKSIKEAIHQAGINRFRPVVMTSITTIFGLIPMMLPFGDGYEFRQSLALSLAGGMFSSTLLTLYLIPLFFEKIEGFRIRRHATKRASNFEAFEKRDSLSTAKS
jgi:HAE1 family hydrophobic/amphiphilic exporter-1